MSDIFPTLVNLQNLTLYLTRESMEQHHSISCPQLLNLNIRIHYSSSLYGNIKVLAPKLCNFTSLGILSIMFEVPELENVKIKLHDWFGNMDWIYRKKYYTLFTNMLSGLGNATNLTFDLDSMKALSVILDLASLPSPFYKLKYVKLPLGYNGSSISSALKSYLLGGSPRATIVTTVPQNRGFNISWAVCRLNYIEHLRFSEPLIPELHAIDCRIHDDRSKLQELEAHVDDIKIKLQDLQALKLTEIEKAFGTNLAVGLIGDDLLSSP